MMLSPPRDPRFDQPARVIRAIGITRVSTAEQAEGDRYSIPHQRARIAEFCDQRGWELTDIAEYVQSGGSNQRELTALLKRVSADAVTVVVVNELDRLARDMITTLLFLEDLKLIGCKFASVTDDIDMTTPDGELKMMLLGLFAHYFRRQLSRKVKGGLLERAREGKHHGGRPPYGYRFDGDTLVPVPEEADVVREIFHHYVRDGWGTRAIAKELVARGVPTKRHGEWNAADLRRLLRKRTYVGDLVHGALEFQTDRTGTTHKFHRDDALIVQGAHPAIVDAETWQEAQRLLDSRKQAGGGRAADSPYLLSGLLRCMLCGRTMVPVRARRGPRYVCRGYQQSGECTSKHAKYVADIETLVVESWWREVGQPSEETVAGILDEWESADQEAGDMKRRHGQWVRRLAALPAMRVRAEDALLQGLFNADQYRQSMARLEAEEGEVRAALSELEVKQRRRWNDPDLVARVVAAWQHAAEEFNAAGDVRSRRAILRRYVRQVEIGMDEVRITWGAAE